MAKVFTRTFISALIILVVVTVTSAQQRPVYSQYLFNGVVINPAFAGSQEALSMQVSNRSQWSGLEGAPQTFLFASHVLFDAQKLGLGVTLNRDKVGVHKNLQVNGSAAYHLHVSEKGRLSFGLQAGLRNHKADYISIMGNQPIDPKVVAADPGRTFFDVGAGVYFRNERLAAGISVPGMLPSNWSANDSVDIRVRNAHWLIFSKYSIPVTHSMTFIPSLLIQYYPGVPLGIDIGGGMIFYDALFTGVSYRLRESVDFLLRANITPQLSFGYAYDLVVGEVTALSNSSHEVSVSYLFKFSRHKIATPR